MINVMLWDHPINKMNGILKQVPLELIYRMISDNKISQVDKIREIFINEGKSELYRLEKNKLSSFLPNVSNAESRSASGVAELSGCMFIDIDLENGARGKLPTDRLKLVNESNKLKDKISKLPFTVACWKSVSDSGVGLLIMFENISSIEFKSKFVFIEELFKQEYGIKIDKKCKNINRQCFISKDENIFINDNPEIFTEEKIGLLSAKMGVRLDDLIINKQLDHLSYYSGPDISKAETEEIFTESYPDIHFRELLGSIDFDMKNNIKNENGSFYFASKFPYVKLPYRRAVILQGYRNRTLTREASDFVFLNGHLGYEFLLKWIENRNKTFCMPNLENGEIVRIADNIWTKYNERCIHPNFKFKHNHWLHLSKATTNEKKKISSKNKKNKTLNKIENKLKEVVESLSQINKSKIARELDLNRKTVIENIKYFDVQKIESFITNYKYSLMNQPYGDLCEAYFIPTYPETLFVRL